LVCGTGSKDSCYPGTGEPKALWVVADLHSQCACVPRYYTLGISTSVRTQLETGLTLKSRYVSDVALHCDKADSVLQAIEEAWRRHAVDNQNQDVYAHLAAVLRQRGFVLDAADGLEILEHCRKHDLPITDILYALDERVRMYGYDGGPLNLVDFVHIEQPISAFYDAARFKTFAEVRPLLQQSVSRTA
jgi:hypothetical protein